MVKRRKKSLRTRKLAAALYHARQNRLARQGGSSPAPASSTIGTTDETGATLETINYLKRGNFYTVTENRKLLTVSGRFTQAKTLDLLIAEVDTVSDRIITILIDDGEVQLTSSTGSAPGEVLEFDISDLNIVFEVGKAYAVVFGSSFASVNQYYIQEGDFPADSEGVMNVKPGIRVRTDSAWSVNVDLTNTSTEKWLQEITHEAA